MSTITEILEPIEQKVRQEYSTPEIIKLFYDIDTIIEDLNGGGLISKPFDAYSAQELSVAGAKLAILRASMVQIQDKAIKNCRKIESSIKLMIPSMRAGIIDKLTKASVAEGKKPPTQGDIEAITDRNLASIKYELGLHEAYLENVRSRWFCIPDILYRIETRIKILEGDKSTNSFYDFDVTMPSVS